MLEHNGKVYARVSDILKPFSDFSHIDPQVLQRKCDIGTQVHEAINDEITGEFPIPGEHGGGYFQSFTRWKSAISPVFLVSEKRYFCGDKMITGCIDALVLLGKNVHLVDFKTSASESPSWVLQAHLYSYLLQVNGMGHSDTFLFVQLCRYGNLPRVYSYKYDQNILAKCFLAIDDFWDKQEKDSH